MRYHSPDRPRDSQGWGRIVAPSGATLGPLQALIVEPLPNGQWEVRLHLQRATATFREYSCIVPDQMVLGFLLAGWQRDPEGVLEGYFHYDFTMDSAPSAHKAQTTLEDLGL